MKNKAFHFLYLILEKVNNNSEVSKSRQLKDKVTKHSKHGTLGSRFAGSLSGLLTTRPT